MCLTPVTVTRSIAGRYYMNNVPCNKCLECVKDRQNEYIIRTIEEQRKRGSMCFFTLTYSPEALPFTEDFDIDEDSGEILSANDVQTLRRADVTLWLRLFKQKCRRRKIDIDFGHMINGEYGPRTMRPHYHGVILGLDNALVDELMDDWRKKYGFVCYRFIPSLVKDVEKVARYCAKYMVKDENWKNLPSDKCERPRMMTSHFYGLPAERRWKRMVDYYQAQDIMRYDVNHPNFKSKKDMYAVVDEIIRRKKYVLGNGKEFRLPNYYKRKIFYYKVEGKERASAIQRMVTYNVQRNFDKDFKEELHNLATLYDIREYSKVVDKYNAVHDDDKFYRAQRYAEINDRYMYKSVY